MKDQNSLKVFEEQDQIFHELKMENNMKLDKIHPLFRQALNWLNQSEYTELDTRNISTIYWPSIVTSCGSQVLKIDGTWDYNYTIPFKLIEMHCPYLQSVLFNVNNQNVLEITSLLSHAINLRSVHLHINEDCEASASIINALTHLPRLSQLLLHGVNINQIHLIGQLVALENLSITIKRDFTPVNLFDILSPVKKLRTLFISNINLSESYSQDSPCAELEEIEIFFCHFPSMLPHFPKLRSLRFRSNFYLYSKFILINWISLHTTSLEDLELLFAHYQNYTDEFNEMEVLKILNCCKNLRILRLYNCVSCLFIESFMNIVRRNGVTSHMPFNLVLQNYEAVQYKFLESPYSEIVHVRGPTQLEKCAWNFMS